MNRSFSPILRCLLLIICISTSTASWAQVCLNCPTIQLTRTIHLKDGLVFDLDFGITSSSADTIAVRMYEKQRYDSGDYEGAFLYGAFADHVSASVQNSSWSVTDPVGQCESAFDCTRPSTDYKARFFRERKRIASAQATTWNDLATLDPTVDVIIEVEFHGGATKADIESIKIPGITGHLFRGDFGEQEDLQVYVRGVDFEVVEIGEGEVKNFTYTENKQFHDISYSRDRAGTITEFTAPTTDAPFYKIWPGKTSVYLLARDKYQIILAWRNELGQKIAVGDIHLVRTNAMRINGLSYSVYGVTKVEQEMATVYGNWNGPYVAARDLAVMGYQENAANRKLLNRADGAYVNDILVAAHRGFWQEAGVAENTIPAYDRALAFVVNQHKADMLEVDVRKTIDGEYIMFHDEYPDRLLKIGDADMSLYSAVPITRFSYKASTADVESGLLLPALKDAILKDRYQTPVAPSQKLLLFGDLINYVRDHKILISLDHAIDDIKPLMKTLMMQPPLSNNDHIEDYFFWKGNGKSDPDYFRSTEGAGILMEQIAFTPVFQEWVWTPNTLEYDAQAYWTKYLNYELNNNWRIPGCEVNFKKEIRNGLAFDDPSGYGPLKTKSKDPGVTYAQHHAALQFVLNNKGNKWIGISPWFPLFGEDPWSPELPSNSKNFAASLDWRADMSFCIDYCKLNYFITDHPEYTLNYWNARN